MDVTPLLDKLDISLSPMIVLNSLIHPSYSMQNPKLRKKNMDYHLWGKTIVEALYATYVYRHKASLTPEMLSKSIEESDHYVSKMIYEYYHLENYILKDRELEAPEETVVALSLIAVIYREYGALKAYGVIKKALMNVSVCRDYGGSISEERSNSLSALIEVIGLPKSSVTPEQMNSILAQAMYVYEKQKQNETASSYMIIIGEKVSRMFCMEYIFENYRLNTISLTEEVNNLLSYSNLSGIIPAYVVNFLEIPSSSFSTGDLKENETLRVNITKGILGAMWINAVKSNNVIREAWTGTFTYDIFARANSGKIHDYKTFLQEFARRMRYTYYDKISTTVIGKKKRTIFSCKILVVANGKTFSETISNRWVRQALNDASGKVLQKMLSHFNWNEEICQSVRKQLDRNSVPAFELRGKGESIPSPYKDDEISVQTRQQKAMVQDKTGNENVSSGKPPAEVSFDGTEHVLYVCKGTIKCRREQHQIISVTGILSGLSGNKKKINVNYCENCDEYFIEYKTYKRYRKSRGFLLGNIYLKESQSEGTFDNLKEESILHLCGYNVKQKDDISSEDRHLILAYLMNKEIVEKYRIIEYLELFIDTNQYRDNRENAVEKWEEDLEWVRNYKIDEQRHVVIGSVEKYR